MSCNLRGLTRHRMDCCLAGSSVRGISQAILELVTISFSRGSSQPRDQTRDSCSAGRFSTTEPPGKLLLLVQIKPSEEKQKVEKSISYTERETPGGLQGSSLAEMSRHPVHPRQPSLRRCSGLATDISLSFSKGSRWETIYIITAPIAVWLNKAIKSFPLFS